MNSKNIPAHARAHLLRVKEMNCVICGQSGPGDAHHIEQRLHYLTLPLCKDCHTGGFSGIHGQKRAWTVRKMTELDALNETIRRLV